MFGAPNIDYDASSGVDSEITCSGAGSQREPSKLTAQCTKSSAELKASHGLRGIDVADLLHGIQHLEADAAPRVAQWLGWQAQERVR